MEKLILLLLLCHWMGDFSPLSTPWMLNAKSIGKPLVPILVHASVHGALMCCVLLFFTSPPLTIILTGLQIGSHFFIDLWKGKMNVWLPSSAKPTNKSYWLLFGFDQLLHQSIILLMAWFVFRA